MPFDLRSHVCSLGTASLILVAMSLGGCGSDSDSAPSPTFKDDAAAQTAVFKGCVPNERPAPETSPEGSKSSTPRTLGTLAVEIDPDKSYQQKYGMDDRVGIGATATPLSAEVRSSYTPPSFSTPGADDTDADRVPAVVVSPDSKGAEFLLVTYRLKNVSEVTTTTSAQISPHLLVRTGGKYYAPSVGCNTDDGTISVAEAYAGQVGAQDPTSGISPGTSAKAVAVYLLPKASGKQAWVSSDNGDHAVPLAEK